MHVWFYFLQVFCFYLLLLKYFTPSGSSGTGLATPGVESHIETYMVESKVKLLVVLT